MIPHDFTYTEGKTIHLFVGRIHILQGKYRIEQRVTAQVPRQGKLFDKLLKWIIRMGVGLHDLLFDVT
ncbi:hypothetical protein D3C74_272720 [compost metagenome]